MLERYQGNWYGIAQSKMARKYITKGCMCNHGTYNLKHDPIYNASYLDVSYYCRKGSISKPETVFEAKVSFTSI